jgi:hypothetical protein
MTDTAALPAVAARDEKGRFADGASGNPLGRPRGRRQEIVELQQRMEIALRQHVSADQLKRIMDSMVDLAIQGDAKAAKLILELFVAKPQATEELAADTPTYVFRIEKALFSNPAKDTITAEIVNNS